jgi:hypothetical protein
VQVIDDGIRESIQDWHVTDVERIRDLAQELDES